MTDYRTSECAHCDAPLGLSNGVWVHEWDTPPDTATDPPWTVTCDGTCRGALATPKEA